MAKFDFDLFTIGAGSGGVAASRRAAAFGARVGGTCVLRGCVPKKLLVYGTHFADEMQDARGYSWTVDGRLDWGALMAAKDRELDRLHGIYVRMLTESNVTILGGQATIAGDNTIEIGGQCYRARHILVATGGRPQRLEIPGADLAIVSDDALLLPALPQRVAIVGGGYIAVRWSARAEDAVGGSLAQIRAYYLGGGRAVQPIAKVIDHSF